MSCSNDGDPSAGPRAGALGRDCVVVSPGHDMAVLPVDAALYARLERDFDGFTGHVLVSHHAFERDWSSWERHPAGDELVVLLSGRVTLRLVAGDEERRHVLDGAGTFAVVPAGVWHTMAVATPSTALFVTPGEGTEHAERPPRGA